MRDDPVRGTYGRALIVIALLLAAVCGCSSAKTAPLGARTDGFDSFAVNGALSAVAVLSAQDSWAVGWTASDHALILRSAGRSWRRVALSGISRRGSLYGVAAISVRDGWAVGSTGTPDRPRALIEHWDGVSWKRVSTRSPVDGSLYGVTAVSARDVWAVGQVGNRALIMHWNGTFWVRSSVPGLVQSSLIGVAAVSASKVWAVGYVGKNISSGKALIERWNGNRWQRMPVHLPAGVSALAAVSTVSGRDAWAVGVEDNKRTLTLNWNGTSWRLLPSPCSRECELSGVAAISTTSAWAVGSSDQRTLVLRWNGQNWRRVISPSPEGGGYLSGVAVLSPRNAWAVGRTSIGAISDSPITVIERWNGAAWR